MKPFHNIAVPHKDILSGKLTMDIFAADLMQVYNHKGPDEYRDSKIFFSKTFLTNGLTSLLNIVEKRLKGEGGDAVIQIQTPFGGGKTHSLIAMFHKAKEWNTKPVVIVGTDLSAEDTLWGVIEKQLTGDIKSFNELTSPGKDRLKKLLEDKQPLLILMDEVLEYVVKASGKTVGQSTLAEQTMAFMQEITETVSSLKNTALIVTLPASLIEHYNKDAEKLFQQLQRVTGRIEKIYTPVDESEISQVIRKRLFSSLDVDEAEKNVSLYIKYAEKEGILPKEVETSVYRDRFISSYPFLPEAIDVLYHRWGSLPGFQRTRGVLRLLASVIYDLKDKNIPYITLADFNLANQEIRQELIKHIGSEFNSVIAQDITDADSGSKRVDLSLGDAYKGLKLATRTTTTIFLYSFSGGAENGCTLNEIKRNAVVIGNPSSLISEALEQLKSKLFFFQQHNEKYFFSNKPNLNRILLVKQENIKEQEVKNYEKQLLRREIKGEVFKVYLWEEKPENIPDTEELKLIVMKQESRDKILNIINNKGASPRINKNTMIFLVPLETEEIGFEKIVKEKLAYEMLINDTTLKIDDRERKQLEEGLRKAESDCREQLRRYYRKIVLPTKSELKDNDLGIPTHGARRCIDEEVYDKLRSDGEILEKISPRVVKEKYLKNNEYIETKNLLNLFYRTPGEPRIANKEVLKNGIIEGVKSGIFGIGELDNTQIKCLYFKEDAVIEFEENEILIREDLCKKEISEENTDEKVVKEPEDIYSGNRATGDEVFESDKSLLSNISIAFKIPKGRVHNVFSMVNYLQNKFENIEISIKATEGKITKQDYEDIILEALRQIGVEVK